MTVDLNGKVALVTGSSRGIGRAIAEGFVRAGACVWFHGPTDDGKAIADSLGQPSVRADFTDAWQVPPLAGVPIESVQHVLQGTSYGTIPPHLQDFAADGYLAVSDEEAIAWQRDLGRLEGLFVGPSSAANVCASLKLARSGDLGASPTIVTLLCDSGLKYV